MSSFKLNSKSFGLAFAFVLFSLALCQIQAKALPSSSEIVQAINKSQLLPSGTIVNVKLDKDQVYISTFRHSNEEKDCKINAVLMAKAVLDLAPDQFARVTCYFFGKELSTYQEVAVTAGDVKSFAAASLDEKQLLASLTVKTVSTVTTADKVARQLESNWISRPSDYKISEEKNVVSVSTALDPWVSDEDAKLEALRIAVNTYRIEPTAQAVKVLFFDPASVADSRELSFSTASLDGLWRSIQSPLLNLSLTKRSPSVDLDSIKIAKGALEEERSKVLAQLKEMESKGIGIAPFLKPFIAIEQSVKRGTDNKEIWESLKRLCANIEDQLKAYNSAKESKKKLAKPVEAAAPPAPPTNTALKASRWTAGKSPIIEGEVLAGPDQLVTRLESEMSQGFAKVEENPKFVLALEQIAAILYKNNRAAEAAKFQQRALSIRSQLKK